MKIETVGGAAIASTIGFLTGFLALMQQSTVSHVADINENAWVVLIVGSAIAFLKDYQAISTRRAIKSMTARGRASSPALIGMAALAMALMLGGCSTLGVDKDRLDTANKQLADKIVFVDKLVSLTRSLNAKQVITVAQARAAARTLQQAKDTLQAAQRAVANNGDPSQAQTTLDRVDQSLAVVLDLLLSVTGAINTGDNYAHHYNYS